MTNHDYILQLGDSNLILSQRLGEWCGHGPVLEQDIALTNMALDLLGQARMLLSYAAELEGKGRAEDDLAGLRDAKEFRNTLLVEQPNEDWAYTIARQFFFDAFQYFNYQALLSSKDERLVGIAEKAIKEVTYHLRFSSDWMLRLGDGTDTSHQKIQIAVNDLWMYTGELWTPSPVESEMSAAGIAPDYAVLGSQWKEKVEAVLHQATLSVPESDFKQLGGKTGKHTEHLGFILADMQFLQRSYPGQQW